MSVKHQESLPRVDEVNGGAVQHHRAAGSVDWEEVTAGTGSSSPQEGSPICTLSSPSVFNINPTYNLIEIQIDPAVF